MKKVLVIAALLSANAFADNHWGRNQQGKNVDDQLQQLVALCEKLESNPQIKKFGAEVTCTGSKTEWEEVPTDRTVELPNVFDVTSSFTMKGNRYSVDPSDAQFPLESNWLECAEKVQVRYEYRPQTIKLTSCQQLKEIYAEGRDNYCSKVLKNGDVLEQGEPTGLVKNTCDQGGTGRRAPRAAR